MMWNMGYRRGVNLGGWLSQCDYSEERLQHFIKEEDIRRIAAWGMDHIRIPVDYNVLEDENGQPIERGCERLEWAMNVAADCGLKVVLDLHKTAGFSFDNGEMETGFFADAACQERFCRLWEQIARRYPHLQITFCVRGGFALNDATRADAEAVGVPFPVIDNGVSMGGTPLEALSEEAKHAMDTADVIISKGMGNAETLLDCGYNIYYAFLVKCIRFEQRFRKPRMTPMLVRERD